MGAPPPWIATHWVAMPDSMSYRRCFLSVNRIGCPELVLPLYLTPLAAPAGTAVTASATSAIKAVVAFLMVPLLGGSWLMRTSLPPIAAGHIEEVPNWNPNIWGLG